MSNIFTKGIQLIKEHSPIGAVRIVLNAKKEKRLERELGIDTSKTVELEELGIADPERKHYGPTEFRDFSCMIKALPEKAFCGAFLDYGAGMGRAMVLAAQNPFSRVFGVELSDELVNMAKNNFSNSQKHFHPNCREVEIFCSDATEFSIPKDVSVVYLNNPFFGTILEKVFLRLQSFRKETPNGLVIICNLPVNSAFEKQVRQVDWLGSAKEFTLPSGRLCMIFEV
jgi:hypothetical protein